MQYIVAACGDWNRDIFQRYLKKVTGEWYYVSTPEELKLNLNKGVRPRYIFFIHWRWFVPRDIYERYECVCFHMTDVPYGRGGSPLQNLILRGHKETTLTALKMEEELDAGPVYLKKPLSLKGSAEEIYIRAAKLSWDIIQEIIKNNPEPMPQKGKPVFFKRRTPEQSELVSDLTIEQLYDFIRMLDAPGYPNAFMDVGNYHLEFENATLCDDEVVATVKFKVKG